MYIGRRIRAVRPALLLTPMLLLISTSGCLDAITGNDRISAYDLIRDDDYTTWVIEIDYVQGHAPTQDVLNTLKSRLNGVVQKDTIDIRLDDQLSSRESWTRADLDRLHDDKLDAKTKGSTVVTHVMYVDGTYSNPDVLGIAVGHEYVTIFSETIDRACASNVLCFASDEVTVRKAVLIHEFGHIIGLVNNGIPMADPHEHPDADKKGHSDSQQSVMWPSAETTGIFGLSTIPTTFDAADKADICKAGGKC